MDRFVSTFTNKLDAKGRVSVPSDFRSVLTRGESTVMFCYPAIDMPSIDAGGDTLVNQIHQLLDNLALYSEERDHLSIALFGVSELLRLDSGGRIILPERLKSHTGITDQATFVGLGDKFQIWAPDQFALHLSKGRDRLRAMKRFLGKEHSNIFFTDRAQT